MAGEVSLLKRQLAPRILPEDSWDWYLVKAGRSAISGSFATYVSNFVKAFGDRLTYLRDGPHLACSGVQGINAGLVSCGAGGRGRLLVLIGFVLPAVAASKLHGLVLLQEKCIRHLCWTS
jgi:hypothetical protein